MTTNSATSLPPPHVPHTWPPKQYQCMSMFSYIEDSEVVEAALPRETSKYCAAFGANLSLGTEVRNGVIIWNVISRN